MMTNKIKITFFGSSRFSVICLERLKILNILPCLIITTPDMPTGRGLKLTATPVKKWATENNIACLSPEKLDSLFLLVWHHMITNYFWSLPMEKSYPKISLCCRHMGR